MKEKQDQLIDKMAESEELISQLYRAYADRFPTLQEFWSGLADEEMEHANSLYELCAKVTGQLPLYIKEDRFKIQAIQTYQEYLQKEIENARKKELLLINALAVSRYIEESLIESKYFEAFETDSVDLKRVLLKLSKDTRVHMNKTKEMLNKYKQSP